MKATTLNSKQDPTWALGISMIHEDRASISAASVDGAGPMITVTVTTEGDKVQIAVTPGDQVTTVTRADDTTDGFTLTSVFAGPYGDDDRCRSCGEHFANPHSPHCSWADPLDAL